MNTEAEKQIILDLPKHLHEEGMLNLMVELLTNDDFCALKLSSDPASLYADFDRALADDRILPRDKAVLQIQRNVTKIVELSGERILNSL